jgi:hypothetical protein
MRGTVRLALPDALVIFAGLWMFIAMAANYDLFTGLESGGALGFDLITGYFLARISLRSPNAVRRLLLLGLPGLAIASATLALEAFTGKIIVRPIFSAIFGDLATSFGGGFIRYEERLGLRRAYGPFPHPILGGLQLSSFLALYALSGLPLAKRRLGILAGSSAFFTLSSAAIIGLTLHIAFMTYERIQKRVGGLSWATLIYTTLTIATLIQLVSKGGILSVVVRYLTLDAWTGYYRMLIWEYAGADVWRSPWFGIGFRSFVRPDWMTSDSIDAHWLLTSIRFGLPCSLSLGLATILALVMLGGAAGRGDRETRSFYIGVAISLFVIGMLMFTVTLWGQTLAWFTILLGAAVGSARGTTAVARTQN